MLARVVQRHIGVGHAVTVVGGLRGFDLVTRGIEHRVAFNHEVGGALVGLRHVLGHLAHAPVGGDVVLARVLVQIAIEQSE